MGSKKITFKKTYTLPNTFTDFFKIDTGEAIKKARTSAGLTQAELAEKLGVTPQAVSQYERNIKSPKIETIQKFADALGVSVWELGGRDTIDHHRFIRIDQNQIGSLAKIIEDNTVENETLELLKGAFYKLNPEGQAKALERVRELSEVPRYQNPDRENAYVKVWCGPTLPDGTQQYTQIHGALSKDMKAFLKAHPYANCLLVPLKEADAVRVMLEHEYTDGEPLPAEKIQYDSLKSELYPAGDAPDDTSPKEK